MKDLSALDELIVGRVEPHIYAFTTNTIPNYLKIGDTYRPVSARLREWKQVYPELVKEYESTAKVDDNIYFRDYSVHHFIETEKEKSRLLPSDLAEGIHYSNEFFKEATTDDVSEAISDITADYNAKSGRYQFYNAATHLPTVERYSSTGMWNPRPNQTATIEAFKKAVDSGRTHLLMYAVMRFGKSFTSMCCAKKINARLVVIVSAKADVKEEWRKTVQSAENFRNDYEFFSSDDLERNHSIIIDTLDNTTNPKYAVVFLTLQDLQGDNIKEKHAQIFGRQIDLLIVDETHFGARAEKYGAVLQNIKGDKEKLSNEEKITVEDVLNETKELDVRITLHLSGTPYRILMSDEFDKEKDLIAFYQFTDIVQDQEKWDEEHFIKIENGEMNPDTGKVYQEWDNPYYGFPKMIRFAFVPNESTRKKMAELRDNGLSNAFSALFKPKSVSKADDGSHKLFEHEREIFDLFSVIDGSKEDSDVLGFLDYEKIKTGQLCRHIVCVLPYCASCDALEALIKNNADKFKNLCEYEIINISGVENQRRYRTPKEIKDTIQKCEADNKKTITLTVNRMLTGSTVPEWDTMIYLKDTSSPQEYDQAIFRLQNQYIKTFTAENGEEIKYNMKPQTLLIDFDPQRVFVMQEQKAQIYNVNVDAAGNSKLSKRLHEELRISPIVTMNANKVQKVTETDILKYISEYSKNRGVAEETNEIPVDKSLMEFDEIRAVIERENELGSKAGFTKVAYDGEEQKLDTPDVSESYQAEESDIENDSENENSGTSEVSANSCSRDKDVVRQFRSYYARILFFAFLTKNTVISLSDIIKCMDTPNNARISKNLGIHKPALESMLAHTDKFILSKLDYKIQNLNMLSHDKGIPPVERASVSVQKFGKLGESEVITPSHICDDMVSMISNEDLKSVMDSNNKILDIAGKAGEFALALCKRFFKLGYMIDSIRDKICTIPTSGITYEFTRMIYESLELNIDNIAAKFTSYNLLKIRNENGDIDCDRIKALLTQDKTFSTITIKDMIEEGKSMVNFSAVVGNPPYQEEGKNNGRKPPIYNYFMDISYDVSDLAVLITPARFLFNAGQTAKEWNKKMLNDEYISVMRYVPKASEVFEDAEIKGGVAITIRNKKSKSGKIGVFTAYPELNTILQKTESNENIEHLDSIIASQGIYRFSDKLFAEHPETSRLSGEGTRAKIVSKIVEHMPAVFVDNKTSGQEYVKFLARINNQRVTKYIRRDYLQENPYIDTYNVMIPESNGDGAFETLSTPVIAHPGEGSADTFISIGEFSTLQEAERALKYIKTKFARALLGVKKVTQHNTKATWEYVPMQDFTDDSDINWNCNIATIDKQLYKKYDLNKQEIFFIESMVKPME